MLDFFWGPEYKYVGTDLEALLGVLPLVLFGCRDLPGI